jgi:hypothetical protein
MSISLTWGMVLDVDNVPNTNTISDVEMKKVIRSESS